MSKFSFIIPVYNCQSYLLDCVKGIQKIGLNNYEILLIDDGSEDNSGKICDSLADTYEEVLCIHQCNKGVSSARNKGIDLADGDYIIFLDADDSIEPNEFHALIELVENDPSIDMAVYGLSFDYFYKGKCYRRDELTTSLTGKITSNVWIKNIIELYDANVISPIWNKIIKKRILDDNQLRLREDMFLYEDMEFSLRCMAHCDCIYFSSEIIYHYRQSEDEGNAGRRLKNIDHIPDLVSKIEAALNILFSSKNMEDSMELKHEILLKLYLILAREKISISDKAGVGTICDDFSKWISFRDVRLTKWNWQFSEELLNRRIIFIIWKRNYTKIRHKVAVWVKSKKAMRNENA